MVDGIKLLKAISDETRFKILGFLLNGEKCVCEIFPHVQRTQSTVSTHLNKLESAGLLTSRREGQKIFYKIGDNRVFSIFKSIQENSLFKGKGNCCRSNCGN